MSAAEIAVTVLVAILGSSALNTVITRHYVKKDRQSANTKGIMFCLLISLQNEARRIIERGYISRLEYNQFSEMYQTYKQLGGDGFADELKKQIDEISRITLQGGQII